VRRNRTTGELAFYRCFTPRPTPLAVLVRVAGRRWTVEEAFQAGKGLCGLDQHQVRRWRSWYRWATLAMLAHIFLVVAALAERTCHPAPPELIPVTCNEVGHLFAALLAQPAGDRDHRLRCRPGDADIKPAPAPAITDGRPPGNHEAAAGCHTSAMELTQVMRTAGSARRFKSDPVPDEVVYRVLDDARFAPSGNNRQGWRVIVVRDRGVRVQLRELYRKAGTPTTPRCSPRRASHPRPTTTPITWTRSRCSWWSSSSKQRSPPRSRRWTPATTSAARRSTRLCKNIVLGLRAAGLGTTLSTVLVPVEAEVKQLLRVPDGVAIAAHLGVGWPAGPLPTRLTRRPVADFATVDAFDGEAFQPGRP
jgi:nitroreductase